MPKLSKHPGVFLTKRARNRKVSWFARHQDPFTGKETWTSLTSLGLCTLSARENWCIRKSQKLKEQKRSIESGELTAEAHLSIAAAVNDYITRSEQRLRPRTVRQYRTALNHIVNWSSENGVVKLKDLTPQRLEWFRDSLLRKPSLKPRVKCKNDEKVKGDERLCPVTVNGILRATTTFLREARRFGRLPNLTMEAIQDRTRRAKEAKGTATPLRPDEIKQLLEAVIRHDSATFSLTREEKALGYKTGGGSTQKHKPIAPMVLTMLLTGCRANEILTLQWESIKLDEQPEIILNSATTKTGHARVISLDVSPTLTTLLKALRLKARGTKYVFGGNDPVSHTEARKARLRLIEGYGAPDHTFQRLRQTTASYLTNAPGIYGGAAAWHSAKRLGHSVTIAERRYAGVIRDIPVEANTLEKAMKIESLATNAVDQLTGLTLPITKRAV